MSETHHQREVRMNPGKETPMLKRLISLGVMTALLGMLAVLPASASSAATQSAARPTSEVSIPVNFTSASGSFAGTFDVTKFAVQNSQVVAIGTLTGTVTDAEGNVVGTVDQALTLPLLSTTTGTCQILHLELGPLDLNLLGLIVHLDKVVLDITAQQGPGNLLGNLLCAIAHALDQTATASALATLLNQLIALLR
jgi:hypothetical protein